MNEKAQYAQSRELTQDEWFQVYQKSRRQYAEMKAEAEKWERLYDLVFDALCHEQKRDSYGETESLEQCAARVLKAMYEWRQCAEELYEMADSVELFLARKTTGALYERLKREAQV
jgi:hypothetical protein